MLSDIQTQREAHLTREQNDFLNSFIAEISKRTLQALCPLFPPKNLSWCLIYKITDSSKTLSSGKTQMPSERSRIKYYQSFLPLFEWFFFFQFDPALFHKRFETAYWKWVDQIWWKPMGTGRECKKEDATNKKRLM